MANITRFDPFNDIRRFDPFLDVNDFFKGFGMRPLTREFEREHRIRMDVSEANGYYMVKAEIPGVHKSDIHVSVDGNVVSIAAEAKMEKEVKKGEKAICSERHFGKLSRSFTLEGEVDSDKVQAKYADGLLELTIPKKAASDRKSISIS